MVPVVLGLGDYGENCLEKNTNYVRKNSEECNRDQNRLVKVFKDRDNCCNFAHTKIRHHESNLFAAFTYCIDFVIV